jgi:hypothetical protein
MTRSRISAAPILLVTLALLVFVTGCRINVDKDANGKDKKVQIDTPFGGIHVNTDKTTALDVGLPVYPGAQPVQDHDSNKSVDVHMGFGSFEMRVRAVSYASPDAQDKVLAFYQKALGSYGNVITCKNHEPIGSPAVTTEGLSCADHENYDHGDNGGDHHHHIGNSENLELKAGSPRHQHIVSFDKPQDGQTRFAIVWLDLPVNPDSHTGQSD